MVDVTEQREDAPPPSHGARQRARRISLTGTRYRHPSDVARMVFAGLIVATILLFDAVLEQQFQQFSRELIIALDGLPPIIVDGTVGLIQVLATVAPIAVLWTLLRQRSWSQLFVVVAAAGFAVIAFWLLDGFVELSIPLDEFGYERVNSWFVGVDYPGPALLASITAVFVALSPQMERRWRRFGWIFLVALLVARVLTATAVPARNLLLLSVGAFAGSAALVVFGAPRRRIDPAMVSGTLNSIGLDVTSPPVERGETASFDVGTTDGDAMVRVRGRDQRDADLLITGWRALMTKGLSNGRALRSPTQAADDEALALSVLGAAGVNVPKLVAVARVGPDTSLIVTSRPSGTPLAQLEDLSDAALADVWSQVAAMQTRRIAHRRLTADNVLVDEGRVTLDDARWVARDATDEQLGADVAELLVVVAQRIGNDRAVESAAASLTDDELRRGVPLIQLAALSPDTRRVLSERDKADDDFAAGDWLDELRTAVAARAGIDDVELAEVQRITIQGAVSLVGAGVLVFYVLSLASDWEAIWDAFTRADLVYVIPILILAFSTYLTGAMSLQGASPIDLGFGRTTAVMFGQSFLNRFTPANAGGMAMRVRYLQLEGLDSASAATTIGLTSAASGVAQGLMIVVFLVWGGASDRLSDFSMPAIGPIVIVILAVGGVVWLILASTWGRQKVRPLLAQATGSARETLSTVASDPGKMAQLLGGATLGKVANIAAFWLAAVAFDVDISFPKAGALYIIATTIGSAVPTPGGVGGVDAALTAALLGYGVPNADAAAIVLLFRLLTFWLPTLPGYISLRYCQRRGFV